MFKSGIEDYIAKMQEYLSDAEDFANCRANEAVENWNNFVNGWF
jgi:hypothetical protein